MSEIPGWLQWLGSFLLGIAGVVATARTGAGQRLLSRAQSGNIAADTLNKRLDALDKAMKKIDELGAAIGELKAKVAILEAFVRAVHHSAPQIGVHVSEGGVLSVEPGAPILVVDDDPDLTQSLKLWLQEDNYTVHTAGTVADALAVVASRQIAVAILDLYIDGSTCLPIVEAIRAATTLRSTQIITYTGATDQAARALIAKIDPVATLNKPCDLRTLGPIIRTALGKREAML